MDFTTQIGGKYSKSNDTLFALKDKLMAAGIKVTHPLAREFISDDTATVYDPAVFSSYTTAMDYYESIATCDFHVVCNTLDGKEGYIGDNTAREILYAMLKGKTIVLLFPPKLKSTVDYLTRQILARHKDNIYVKNLVKLSTQELETFFRKLASQPADYDLTAREIMLIRSKIRAFFRQLA